MMLLSLLLPAYGPFTDERLDFADPAGAEGNLCLVYGANEAGKSSALGAMTDLRFGIQQKTTADFIHAYGNLRVGGVFLDEQGRRVGLMRRKGRVDTLSRIDPDTGQPLDPAQPDPGMELALTAGLSRDEFKAVFGLDHARLRQGGERLLKGEGELGAALFEASAGTRGIASLLQELEAEAKAFYMDRGQNAVINQARNEYDTQRKRLRDAQIRPGDWHTLQRAHERDSESLAAINQRLSVLNRRQTELAELRTVAAMLRELDAEKARLRTLADAPDLPESAREQRLAAEQAALRAGRDLADAEAAIQRCGSELQTLRIETGVLEHADVIERLTAEVDAYDRGRRELGQQEAGAAAAAAALDEIARCIDPGLAAGDLLQQRPSDSERAALDQHLDDCRSLQQQRSGALRRLDELRQIDADEAAAEAAPVAAGLRQSLEAALAKARRLGDSDRLQVEAVEEARRLEEAVQQALHDLRADSVDQLREAQPLLDAQIDEAAEAVRRFDEGIREQQLATERLAAEIADLQERGERLLAEGEKVTLETLRQARAHRDRGWRLIREIHIEHRAGAEALAAGYDPQRPLAEAFTLAQDAADRQADLLREHAERAAAIAENDAAMNRCRQKQARLDEQLAALRQSRETWQRDWFDRLATAPLPALSPPALREWQGKRGAALELADRLTRRRLEARRLAEAEAGARAELVAALTAVGQSVTAAQSLDELIALGQRWERAQTEAAAEQSARQRARRQREGEIEKLQQLDAAANEELHRLDTLLQGWRRRLLLPETAPPVAFKARLGEFDQLARRHEELLNTQQRCRQQRSVLEHFERRAAEIAGLLDEPRPAVPDDYAERLRHRLQTAREALQRRDRLQHDLDRARTERARAETEQAQQADVLQRLCAQAGVTDPARLEGVEERATLKRRARESVSAMQEQLARASSRPEAELRAALADADPVELDAQREDCDIELQRLEQAQADARRAEEASRRELEAVDTGDAAAEARERMESAVAGMRQAVLPWARLRLARALLRDALGRYRERAQAPMVRLAGEYFSIISGGRYTRLSADEDAAQPRLRAVRFDGVSLGVSEMSEGTADQLYLALRLAALSLRRESHPPMPLVLDDVLVTSDDARAVRVFRALAQFAETGQVMLFTHHRHLIDLARQALGESGLRVLELSA